MFYACYMQSKKSVIIIFGFSGSGKSTVAELLAQKLGLRVVHPSSILRNILEGKKINLTKTQKGIGFWETKRE